MTEGVDYSRTANGDWRGLAETLVAAGKHFVVRYAVSDRSPTGRGITAAEYAAMRDAGLDVGLYWEGTESWMLGGYTAGVSAAQNAQANIVAAGMPPTMPIYFAHDIDPQPMHFDEIDACLRGCASVVGWERVGVYGGWLLMDYMAKGGTVQWLAQTSAWEYGRGVHPKVAIYQYAYNQYFYGTNCDLVRALREDWGQAASFLIPPVVVVPDPPPVPQPASIYPKGMNEAIARERFGRVKKSYGDFRFDPNGPVSQAWLKQIRDQLEEGESYLSANIGPLTSVVRRGKDRRFIDFGFSGMRTIRLDATTGTVVP